MFLLAPSARRSWCSHASLQLGLEMEGGEECGVDRMEEKEEVFAEVTVGSGEQGGRASMLLWSCGTQPKMTVSPSAWQHIQHPYWERGCRSPFLPGVAWRLGDRFLVPGFGVAHCSLSSPMAQKG